MDIPPIPRTLDNKLRAGKVIPFVGAGVSRAVLDKETREPLFPDWSELLERAAQRLDEDRQPRHANEVRDFLNSGDSKGYLNAAARAHEGLQGSWFNFLDEQLRPKSDRAHGASLNLARSVWELGSNLVITTNYDRVLYWTHPNPKDLWTWNIQNVAGMQKALGEGIQESTLWNLHGHIGEAANMILTLEHYRRLYPEARQLEVDYEVARIVLRSFIVSHCFLFIGFSLRDPYLSMQLQEVYKLFRGTPGPHYILLRAADVAEFEARRTAAGLPVRAIPVAEHGQPLLELLRALAEISRQAPRERPRDDELMLNIREPGLEIYLTGELVGWEKNSRLQYEETPEGYRLFFSRDRVGDKYKHFVICDEADVGRIKNILTHRGYQVTGVDDDEEGDKKRVWFLLGEDYPHTGEDPFINNLWPRS